jgi:hypothetical protein
MSFLIGKTGACPHRVGGRGERGGNERSCGEQRIMRSIVLYFEREFLHPLEIMSRSVWTEGDCMKRKRFSNRTVSVALGKVEGNSPSLNG